MHHSYLFLIGLIVTLFLSGAGCSIHEDDNSTAAIAPSLPPQIEEEIRSIVESQSFPHLPIKIGIALDLTGSREEHRIQMPKTSDLQKLIELVRTHGGEVAVLSICDDSNRPMLRLRISPAPSLDETQFEKLTPPTPPDENTNPFYLEEAKAEYQKQQELYDEAQAKNQQILERYKQSYAAWENETQLKIDEFFVQVIPLLKAKPSCPATDIYGAKQRFEVFFLEDPIAFSSQPRSFAIFISDLIDTVGRPQVEMQSDAEILLVNGSGSRGVFSSTKQKMFESPTAAFDYITATIEQGGGN